MPTKGHVPIRLSLEDGELVRKGLMSLGADGEKALKRIGLATAPASKGLLAVNTVSGELQHNMRGLAGRAGVAGQALSAMGPAGLAAGAALAVVTLGMGRALAEARVLAQEMDALDDAANDAGFGVERFQELRFAAGQVGVSVRELDEGLRRFTRRIGELANSGAGPAEKAFDQLGISIRNSSGEVRASDDILDEVITKLQGVSSAAQRSALTAQLFGDDAGPKLRKLLDLGAEGMADMTRQAREMGVVIDAAMVKRAADATDKLAALQTVVRSNLTVALVDLMPILIGLAEGFASVARSVADLVDGFKSIETMSRRGLEGRLEKLNEFFTRRPEAPNGGHALRLWREKFDERERIQLQLMQMADQARGPATEGVGLLGPVAEGVDRDAERIARTIEGLQARIDDFGLTEFGQQMHGQLRQAGIDIDESSQTGRYWREAKQIAQLTLELKKLEDAQKAHEKGLKEAEALTAKLATAEEKRAGQLAQIDRLLESGFITQEEAARAVAQAAEQFEAAERRKLEASREAADGIKRALRGIGEESANMAAILEGHITSLNGDFRGFFVDVTHGSRSFFDGLGDLAQNFSRRLAGTLYDRAVGGVVDSLLGGIGGGFFGGSTVSAAVRHGGGGVGDAGPVRQVPALAFAGAPRLHEGGFYPGERRVIMRDDERVLTLAQQQNTAATVAGLARLAGGGRGAISVTVNNNAGEVARADAEVVEDGQGGAHVHVMVEQIKGQMADDVRRGGLFSQTLEGTYGLSRAGGARY